MEDLQKILDQNPDEEKLRKAFQMNHKNYLFYYLESTFEKENQLLKDEIIFNVEQNTFNLFEKEEYIARKVIQKLLKKEDFGEELESGFYCRVFGKLLDLNSNYFVILKEEMEVQDDRYQTGKDYCILLELFSIWIHRWIVSMEDDNCFTFHMDLLENSILTDYFAIEWPRDILPKASKREDFFKRIQSSMLYKYTSMNNAFFEFMNDLIHFISKEEVVEILTFLEQFIDILEDHKTDIFFNFFGSVVTIVDFEYFSR
jgi:hypothetical protein